MMGFTYASNAKTMAAWTTVTATNAHVHIELGIYILGDFIGPPPAE